MTLLVDPPSGWMYGFLAPLQDDYEQQLRDAGYPEWDIPLALKHSRYMGDREDLEASRDARENLYNQEVQGNNLESLQAANNYEKQVEGGKD